MSELVFLNEQDERDEADLRAWAERPLEGVDDLAGEPPGPEPVSAPVSVDFSTVCLSVEAWLERDLPAPDFLLGDVFSTTSRGELIGPTGLGKTNLCLAMACGKAAGVGFLHLDSRRPAKVLYVDGELSRRWFQKLTTQMMAEIPAAALPSRPGKILKGIMRISAPKRAESVKFWRKGLSKEQGCPR